MARVAGTADLDVILQWNIFHNPFVAELYESIVQQFLNRVFQWFLSSGQRSPIVKEIVLWLQRCIGQFEYTFHV